MKVAVRFGLNIYYLNSADYHDYATRQIEEERQEANELQLNGECSFLVPNRSRSASSGSNTISC
jgi:hypothetical protein